MVLWRIRFSHWSIPSIDQYLPSNLSVPSQVSVVLSVCSEHLAMSIVSTEQCQSQRISRGVRESRRRRELHCSIIVVSSGTWKWCPLLDLFWALSPFLADGNRNSLNCRTHEQGLSTKLLSFIPEACEGVGATTVLWGPLGRPYCPPAASWVYLLLQETRSKHHNNNQEASQWGIYRARNLCTEWWVFIGEERVQCVSFQCHEKISRAVFAFSRQAGLQCPLWICAVQLSWTIKEDIHRTAAEIDTFHCF